VVYRLLLRFSAGLSGIMIKDFVVFPSLSRRMMCSYLEISYRRLLPVPYLLTNHDRFPRVIRLYVIPATKKRHYITSGAIHKASVLLIFESPVKISAGRSDAEVFRSGHN
jgi:hypothetical protein